MKSNTLAARLAVAAASLAVLAGCTAAATPSPSTALVSPSASPSRGIAPSADSGWAVTGSMHADHVGHTATLLPDGTVLVVGLGTRADAVPAELFDPTSGEWTVTAGPLVTRGLTATMLLDGRVLVTGDLSDDSRVAEVYDPSLAN